MLMNLTRMRKLNWEDKIVAFYREFMFQIEIGDQDLINIFFHYNPKNVYVLPCNFNYRTTHW